MGFALLRPPVRASALPAPSVSPAWGLPELSGRLVELSGSRDAAHVTAAFGLVLEAQLTGDRAAWITLERSAFFPPDAADGGVDLAALPVVRLRDAQLAGRAAEQLLRSGGFGLVVIDLSDTAGPKGPAPQATLPVPALTRLLGLARQHEATVLMLTRKSHEHPSINSLISLRAEARRVARGIGEYAIELEVLKDKRGGPGWTHVELCRGAAGLR